MIADKILLEANEWGGHLAAMASAEMEGSHPIPHRFPNGECLLLLDPLDGSSNIDMNTGIGTIFSALKCLKGVTTPTEQDFPQSGASQRRAALILGANNEVERVIGYHRETSL